MAYTDLKADIIKHIKRPNLAAEAGNFVARGEDVLNRKLPAVETDAALVATIGSREISLSSLAITRPVALFRKTDGGEVEVNAADGLMPLYDDAGAPRLYDIQPGKLVFDRPADQAYAFRFRYVARFALSDLVTTNWLLENHYDTYLAASLVPAYARQEDFQSAAQWDRKAISLIRQVKAALAEFDTSDLRVDPALQMIGRHHGVC